MIFASVCVRVTDGRTDGWTMAIECCIALAKLQCSKNY